MVDLFSLVLTHALLALAAWRLMQREDLDRDPAPEPAHTVPAGDASPELVPALSPGEPLHGVPRLASLGRGLTSRTSGGGRDRA